MAEFLKMNTLLAKVDHATASVAKLFSDYVQFFKNKQGMFRGYKKTYVPRDGYVDDPSKMGTTIVATTVDEKLDWFNEQFKNWLNDVFSVEATNSKGAKTVELVVDGKSFGNLTALELMRLKSILTNKDLEAVFANIPVRSDAEVWTPTQDPEYNGRKVFETALIKGVTRTTEKEEVILKDPNLDPAHLPANYQAKTTIKSKTVETGDYTTQSFTGEWTQRQRAELLRRRSTLLAAVIEALKVVNDTPAENPNLDVNAVVDYIYRG
jgi:hypothetical protein